MKSVAKIFGPNLPAKERKQFDKKGWNPRKPCDIFNPYPVKKWPFKPNDKVFFVFGKTSIIPGRVTWYHPAREIDADTCVSPGVPFFNIRNGGMSYLPSASDVFPGTKKGWLDARALVADNLFKSIKEEEDASARRIEGIKESISIVVAAKCPLG